MRAKTIPKTHHRVVFSKFFPPNQSKLAFQAWEKHRFNFRIAAPRATRFGDFCAKDGVLAISVNGDLPPFMFAFVFWHELAHLLVFKTYKGKVLPHGKEWKKSFGDLLRFTLHKEMWPSEALVFLTDFAKSPSASLSDPHLFSALGYHIQATDASKVVLGNLLDSNGQPSFRYRNRTFYIQEKKRTRIWAKEAKTGKVYAFAQHALVEPI